MRETFTGVGVIALVVALTLSTAGAASAAPVNWSPPTTLSSGAGMPMNAQVVTDGTTVTAIWSAFEGPFHRVQTSSSLDGGVTWPPAVTLSTSFIGEEESEEEGADLLRSELVAFLGQPQLVRAGATITAIWTALDDDLPRVQTSSSADDGLTWSRPSDFEGFDGASFSPQLVAHGERITAIWTAVFFDSEFSGTEFRLQTSTWADDGDGWSDPVFITEEDFGSFNPQLVTDGNTITAIWNAYDEDNGKIQTSTWADDGDGWSDPDVISGAVPHPFNLEDFRPEIMKLLSPQLVRDGEIITAIWNAFGETDETPQIQTSFSADNGDTWSDPVFISRDGQPSFTPQLVSDDGIVTAIWLAIDESDELGENVQIQTSTRANAVDGWSVPDVIGTTDLEGFPIDSLFFLSPQLVSDGGTITAIWSAFGENGELRIQTSSWANDVDGWSVPAVISAEGQDSFDSQLVSDGDTITAIWSAFDGVTSGIQTSSLASDGSWSRPDIISDVGGVGVEPQLVTDGDTVTAIWVGFDDLVAFGGNGRIQTSSWANDRDGWSDPVFISTEGQDSFDPQLVSVGGTITAIWRAFDGDIAGIQTSSWANNGDTWSEPVVISTEGQDSFDPQLISVGGTITAIWSAFVDGNAGIQTSFWANNGDTWSEPVVISTEGQDSFDPQLVSDGGTITAIWGVFDGDIGGIQTSFWANNGDTWSEPVVISTEGQDSFSPQLVSDGGTITAIWGVFDGDIGEIQTSSWANDGDSWSDPVVISTEGQDSFSPQLVSDGKTITAMWTAIDRDDSLQIQTSSSTDAGRTWISPVTLPALGPMIRFVDEAAGWFIDSNAGNGIQMVTDGTTVTAIWFNPSTFRIQTSSAANVTPTPPRTPPAQLAATGVSDYFGLGVLAGGLLLSGFVALSFKSRQRGVFLRD
jgi:hypothetical protein